MKRIVEIYDEIKNEIRLYTGKRYENIYFEMKKKLENDGYYTITDIEEKPKNFLSSIYNNKENINRELEIAMHCYDPDFVYNKFINYSKKNLRHALLFYFGYKEFLSISKSIYCPIHKNKVSSTDTMEFGWFFDEYFASFMPLEITYFFYLINHYIYHHTNYKNSLSYLKQNKNKYSYNIEYRRASNRAARKLLSYIYEDEVIKESTKMKIFEFIECFDFFETKTKEKLKSTVERNEK